MKHINLTHLARNVSFGHKPTLKERVLAALYPAHRRVENHMRAIGAILDVTYNYKGGVSGSNSAGMSYSPGGVNVSSIKLDFAAIAAARSAAGQAAIGAADVLELFTAKAGTWVVAAFVEVVTAEGAAATGQLGDGTDPNGFIETAGLNLNTVGWSSSLITSAFSVATAGGKVYTADDTVDLTIDSASVDVAVAHLSLLHVDLRRARS